MIDFSTIKKLTVDGINLKCLAINGVQVWKSGYKNWIPFSTNADGTIYNNGLGYKDGYRIRSGGAESEQENTSCSGFIPVCAGDIVRLSGWDFGFNSMGNSINAYDLSFTNLGQLVANFPLGGYGIFAKDGAYIDYSWKSVVEESSGIWRWIVPSVASGVAYIRVAGFQTADSPGADMIVTVNEEINV